MDVVKRRLWRGDQPVPLTRKAFDTLLTLVQHGTQVVDKDDLLRIVWPDTFVSDETLAQNIATIRRALADSATNPEYIATVPRRGYQFVALVTPEPEREASTAPEGTVRPIELENQPASTRWPHLVVIGLALSALVMTGGTVQYLRMGTSPSSFGGEWQVNPPPGTSLVTGGVLSPDARSIAFVAIDAFGTTGLWLQQLGSLEATRLAGTDGARAPFWHHDGKSIAFTAGRKLKRIDLAAKTQHVLAATSVAQFKDQGGVSSATGLYLCSPMEGGPLYKLTEGGTFEPVTRLETGERVHLWPSFLPDGRHFIYRAATFDDDASATYVGSLDAPGERIRLHGVTSAAIYSSGYMLFVRDGSLVAQRFDAKRLRLDGTPMQVASSVAFPAESHGMTFSASGDVVSYIAPGSTKQLTWFDRAGTPIGSLVGGTDLTNPALSPDNKQFAANRPKPDVGYEIWMGSAVSGESFRLSTGLPLSGLATWSPDGQRIAFMSAGDLYWVPSGGGQATLIRKAANHEQPLRLQDWSADGRYLVFYTLSPLTNADLWWLSLADGRIEPFRHGPANEVPAQVSPDSRWVAYASDAMGKWDETEIFVEPFPTGGVPQKVSEGGGGQPRWRADGRELFYLSLESDLIAVDVEPGNPLHFGRPRKLFHVALNEPIRDVRNSFAVSRDGSRFLFSARPANATPITVRFNWAAQLHN